MPMGMEIMSIHTTLGSEKKLRVKNLTSSVAAADRPDTTHKNTNV